MTDKPSTLSLAAQEWRTLIVSNLAQATDFVQKNEQIISEGETMLNTHLERVKALVTAWRLSSPPVQVQTPPEMDANAIQAAKVQSAVNGTNEPIPFARTKRKYTRRAKPEATATQ